MSYCIKTSYCEECRRKQLYIRMFFFSLNEIWSRSKERENLLPLNLSKENKTEYETVIIIQGISTVVINDVLVMVILASVSPLNLPQRMLCVTFFDLKIIFCFFLLLFSTVLFVLFVSHLLSFFFSRIKNKKYSKYVGMSLKVIIYNPKKKTMSR